MADSGMYRGCDCNVLVGEADPPVTQINWITSADVSLDGKLVDVTSFTATCAGYVKNKQAIKDLKITLKGFLDRADAGQAVLWTHWGTPTITLRCKINFGPTPTYYLNAAVTVDGISPSFGATKLNEVTYSLSGGANAVATKLDS